VYNKHTNEFRHHLDNSLLNDRITERVTDWFTLKQTEYSM
jgi:hypothetical protein